MAFSNFVPMMFKIQSPNPSDTSCERICPLSMVLMAWLTGVCGPSFTHSSHVVTQPSWLPLASEDGYDLHPDITVMFLLLNRRYDSNTTLVTVRIKVSHYSMRISPGLPNAHFFERKQRNICWKRCCENNTTWEKRMRVRVRDDGDMQRGEGHTCSFWYSQISKTKENPHNRTVAMASPTISDHCFL